MTTLNNVQQVAEAVQAAIYVAAGPNADGFTSDEAAACADVLKNWCQQLNLPVSEAISELRTLERQGSINSSNLRAVERYV